MSTKNYVSGTVLKVTDSTSKGIVSYTVNQKPHLNTLPKPANENRQDFHLSLTDNFKINGYIVTDTLEIGAEVIVFGIRLGSFYGNAKDGVNVTINLIFASGHANFYIKNVDVEENDSDGDPETVTKREFHVSYKLTLIGQTSPLADGDTLILTL